MRTHHLLAATTLVASALLATPATACAPLVTDPAGDTAWQGLAPTAGVLTVDRVDLLGVDLWADGTSVVGILRVASLAGPVLAETYDTYRVTFEVGGQPYYLQAWTSPPRFEYGAVGSHPRRARGGFFAATGDVEVVGSIPAVAPGDVLTGVTGTAAAGWVAPGGATVYAIDTTAAGPYTAGTSPCLPVQRPQH
jgi:hypothetical protein